MGTAAAILKTTYRNVPSRLMGRVCIALKQETSVSRGKTRPALIGELHLRSGAIRVIHLMLVLASSCKWLTYEILGF